ncbi:MAG: hypothetical protein HYZ01_03725 [Ignavibacteriales bacterium]|nr:hypothetical protein [Ignavibacteriales bacterium]
MNIDPLLPEKCGQKLCERQLGVFLTGSRTPHRVHAGDGDKVCKKLYNRFHHILRLTCFPRLGGFRY